MERRPRTQFATAKRRLAHLSAWVDFAMLFHSAAEGVRNAGQITQE